jgi:hypothetical protein
MALLHRKLYLMITAIAIAVGVATVPLFGDTHGGMPKAMPKFSCYCECEKSGGHSICPMKMCEIPKYEKRWWATSCHKNTELKPSAKPAKPSPGPNAHHDHNIQNAKK